MKEADSRNDAISTAKWMMNHTGNITWPIDSLSDSSCMFLSVFFHSLLLCNISAQVIQIQNVTGFLMGKDGCTKTCNNVVKIWI